LLPEDSKSQEWLNNDTKGISCIHRSFQDFRFRIKLDKDILDSLKDRLDGVALLAEALSHTHPMGMFHEFLRFFERAFARSSSRPAKPLAQFLAESRRGYTQEEIQRWVVELRHPATHADRRPSFALESDIRPVIRRMKQAAYDVLFNKAKWQDSTTERRKIMVPPAGIASKSHDIYIVKGTAGIDLQFQLLDGFYSYPLDEAILVGSLITRSEVPVALSVKGFRRHLALLAQTGSGKTYLAGILADELLAKGGTVVMLDPHADYVFLGRDAAGKRHELSDRITVFRNPSSTGRYSEGEVGKVEPYEICFSDLDFEEISLIANIGKHMTNIRDGLEQAIEFLREKKDVFVSTLAFLRQNKVPVAYFNILTPHKGTPLYDRMKAENRIIDMDHIGRWPGIICYIQPKDYSPRELEEKVKKMYMDFYRYSSMLARLPLPFTKANIASWVVNFSQRKVTRAGEAENFDDY
jgi:hypothetical protein